MKYATIKVTYTDGQKQELEKVKLNTLDLFQDKMTFLNSANATYCIEINTVEKWEIIADRETEEDEIKTAIKEEVQKAKGHLKNAENLQNGLKEKWKDIEPLISLTQQMLNNMTNK